MRWGIGESVDTPYRSLRCPWPITYWRYMMRELKPEELLLVSGGCGRGKGGKGKKKKSYGSRQGGCYGSSHGSSHGSSNHSSNCAPGNGGGGGGGGGGPVPEGQ